MNKFRPLPAVLALTSLLLAPASFAAKADGPKAKAMAKYDLDQDGKLSDAEIAALTKDFAAAPTGDLARFDTDKNGQLSVEELAKVVPGSGRKGEKKGDGEKKGGGVKKKDLGK